ncbi:MAG: TonB-dependent receptor [Acidobacteria bacterium]|nr:TonB-dependent receptor [Acidobacteriota bacterium]
MSHSILLFALAACLLPAQEPKQPEPPKITVLVTGSYLPVPAEESNRAVESLPVGHTRILYGSFADLLKDDASVDLRQRGPNDIQGDLSIRGGSFSQNLILLNGLRLNDTQSAHHNLDLPLPMEAFSEAQLLRGSGSTQYGSDAVTGVLNLLTGFSQSEVRLRGAVGNFGVNHESGSIALGGEKLSQQLYFTRDFSSGFRPNRDYRNLGLASITHATSRLGFSDIVLSMSDRPFGADQFYGNYNSWERTRGWFASLRQELGPKTEASFAYRRHTDLFVLYRDRPQVFTNRHAVESWQIALRRREDLPASSRLFYGVESYGDTIQSNNLGDHSRIRQAAYATYELTLRKRFSLSAGVRDEIYSSLNHQLSPTFSAAYWLGRGWKLRGAMSRAFRLPSYTDLYYHDPANAGSPDLRPEKAWNYEGALEWRSGRTIRAEAGPFSRHDRDLIDYVRYSATDIYRATNFQRLTFTGFEGRIEWRPASAQLLRASYTALHGDRALLPGAISKYVFNYPTQSAVLSWQGALTRHLASRTRIGIVDRYSRDAYALWDTSIARANGRLRPFFRLTNITSTSYEEIPGVIMPGRGVIGGMEWILHGTR